MSRGLDNSNHDYVYRALRPDESPHRDIVCKDRRSFRSISEHVADGLKYPSRFISTSASFNKANKWISTSNCRTPSEYSNLKPRDTIVEIDVKLLKQNYPSIANSAYDFTNHNVRSNFLNTDKQCGYADGYKEVVFDTRIPSEVVSNIYVMGKGWIGNKAEQATNTPEPVLYNSSMATANVLSLVINSPNNYSAITADIPSLAVTTPFELTLSTQFQSSTVDSIKVDTIKRVRGTTRFKRKLTYEDVATPLKYTCEEAQVQPLPMLTRARARIEEMERNLPLLPIRQIRRSNRNISKPPHLNNYILS